MINLNQYEVLTFDCYGTLIDWEKGVLEALQPVLQSHKIQLSEKEILEWFARFESSLEQGEYRKYKDVLRGVVQKFGEQFGFTPSSGELNALADSIKNWQPFADTVEALKRLKQRFKLAIISNVDDDLFAFSAKHLQVEFDEVVTAQQVQSYKPSVQNFQVAIARLAEIGIPSEKILHVACSVYHDIVPANSLGLSTVWVNRRLGQEGSGAALPAQGKPDLEVPDLKSLAAKINF
ncbi:haloacid dehalogenase type II [Brasilonema bromeliae]|uniref:Haloacid dehalogenase type II n=1 Tax=Brasilonema bromeliae SPC951 TaxID=385972 RepID=A0ABX1P6P3_9CYAN|nr:haloacid dehalogenase type II [Brasilonema bromeliae]NMG20034.1 haloacid dehalogenase type II [Brasilonema bromeliae SPC951]